MLLLRCICSVWYNQNIHHLLFMEQLLNSYSEYTQAILTGLEIKSQPDLKVTAWSNI